MTRGMPFAANGRHAHGLDRKPNGRSKIRKAAACAIMRPSLASLIAFGLVSCAPFDRPPALIRVAQAKFGGGEALFRGKLEVRNGCVVTAGTHPATVLFDPDVALVNQGTGIRDGRRDLTIRFGEPIRASAAWPRNNGNGWSVMEIERFYGTNIPDNCPHDEVVRLDALEPTE